MEARESLFSQKCACGIVSASSLVAYRINSFRRARSLVRSFARTHAGRGEVFHFSGVSFPSSCGVAYTMHVMRTRGWQLNGLTTFRLTCLTEQYIIYTTASFNWQERRNRSRSSRMCLMGRSGSIARKSVRIKSAARR